MRLTECLAQELRCVYSFSRQSLGAYVCDILCWGNKDEGVVPALGADRHVGGDRHGNE